MGIKERKEKQKDALRREIMAAARELFVEHGYRNVSMRKIADKIEYSPTTIYLYFKDKQSLLSSICEETFGLLHQALQRIENTSNDPLICLEKGMRTYIDFGLAHPNDYAMVFMTMPDAQSAEAVIDYQYDGSMGQQAFSHLIRMVAACMEAGKIKNGEVAVLSQTIWATLHGITALLITQQDFPFVPREILIDSVLTTLIDGLRTER